MNAGRDSIGKSTTEIDVSIDPSAYDYLVLGSPKWAVGNSTGDSYVSDTIFLEGKKDSDIQRE